MTEQIPFNDLKAQYQGISHQIEEAIGNVLQHGRYIMGPEVGQLEAELAQHVGARHAIGCSSGTDALLLPLMAYGVGLGDAIFTSAFSFFATAEVISLLGATPVFVDIDETTLNLDPGELHRAVEEVEKTPGLTARGIIPVDLFGQCADYDPIMELAKERGLFVLEDAAQSFGAVYKGAVAPGLAHVGATSFFPAKPLGCYGDGGAVFTNDDELAAVIRSLLVHGKGESKYDNVRIGLNARLDTIQAAVLLEKLRVFPEETARKQALADWFSTEILNANGGRYQVTPPEVSADCRSVWAQYTVRCKHRDQLQEQLSKKGIPSMVYYRKPLNKLEAMQGKCISIGALKNSVAASESVLSLPMHAYLKENHQQQIVEALVDA